MTSLFGRTPACRAFRGQTPFEHWLSGIAVRTCYDFWRARRREELPVSALTTEHQAWMDHVQAAESDDQFREQAKQQEAAELLQWALGHLSAENRLVLTLVHLDGYSVREAARLLGWSCREREGASASGAPHSSQTTTRKEATGR